MSDEFLRKMVREAVRQALGAGQDDAKPAPAAYRAPWTGVEYEAHPSNRQFNIAEASITAADIIEFVESKICTVENNKPCDNCGMCRSLGF